MKKILASVSLGILLTACSTKPVDYAVLKGKVTTSEEKLVRVYLGNKEVKAISVQPDGTFNDTIRDLGTRNNYLLVIDRKQVVPVFLRKGTELDLNISESTSVAGKDFENTQFLIEKAKYITENLDQKMQQLYMSPPDVFKKELTSVFSGLKELLKKHKLESSYVQTQEKWADYKLISLLNQYPQAYRYFTREEAQLPEGFMSKTDHIDYDNAAEYDNNNAYVELVQRYYFDSLASENPEVVKKQFERIKAIKSENIKQDFAQFFMHFISLEKPELNADFRDFILANSNDENLKKEAQNAYDSAQKLASGTPAPTFEYPNIKGEKVSLQSLLGKVVYVDVWATWCGPCRFEIPHLKELEKSFHGKNVAFVSISIDEVKDQQKWKDFIAQNGLGGIQLMADAAWKSQIVSDYLIQGIPRFILIDKEGKLVSADASRPSDPQTKQKIQSLL